MEYQKFSENINAFGGIAFRMSSIHQVLKNVSFNWIGMAVSIILGFVQAPIVVKGLGNTWFGIWVLVSQIVNYTWLFDLGIREAIVRYVSKHHARKEFNEINKIISSATYLYLLISLLTLIVISIATILLPYLFKLGQDVAGIARLVLFISGLNIAINWFFNSYVGVLMGLQRFDILQKIGMGIGVASFVLVITFIKAGYGVIALSLINLTASLASNILIYWNCRRLLPGLKQVRYDKNKLNFKQFINYGKYVFLNNIGEKIISGTDGLIIGMFIQVSAITYYAIPATLVNMLKNLLSSAAWVINPLFSELEANDEMDRVKKTFSKATKLSLLTGLPIGIVYLFMGKNFISLWMGKDYGEGSALVLILLTLGTLFTIWEKIINSALYGLSRHHIVAWLRVAEAVSIILLSILFVKLWGIIGVAFANSMSHILFMGVVLPIVVCDDLDISIFAYVRQSIFPPILSSLFFALCCYLLNAYLPATNLAVFFLSIAAIMPVFILSAWYISFTRAERIEYAQKIRQYVPWLGISFR